MEGFWKDTKNKVFFLDYFITPNINTFINFRLPFLPSFHGQFNNMNFKSLKPHPSIPLPPTIYTTITLVSLSIIYFSLP